MQSLFLRMRLVHWVGFTLLILSATFFTSDLIGKAIQYIVALVVLVHDFDEKNGVSIRSNRWPATCNILVARI